MWTKRMPMQPTRREFLRTLFVATQATALGGFLPQGLHAATDIAHSGGLNFIVFGDWGRGGQPDQLQVARHMAAEAETVGARFVISVGDNFYTDGVASSHDPQWQTSFENVYRASSLQIPWYVALGNHDYRGNCDAQIAYGKTSARWKMPARYFMQSHSIDATTGVDFFFLDTTPMVRGYYRDDIYRNKVNAQDVGRQLAWFEDALVASTARWKIVVGHHPIYSGGEHGDTPELIATVLPLLKQHGVQAYFNGHDHDLQHLMAGRVHLFDSGAGSEFRDTAKTAHTKFARACSGFTTVSLHADAMHVRMIDSLGRVLYTTSVPQAVV